MVGVIFGALIGGAAVWFWRDKLAAAFDEKTRGLRQKAVETLDTVEKQTENLLDKAKPQITSTLRAGKDMLRPAESGSPRPHEAGTDPSRPMG